MPLFTRLDIPFMWLLGKKKKERGKKAGEIPPPSGIASSYNPEITFGIEFEFVLCIEMHRIPEDSAREYFRWASKRLNRERELANQVISSFMSRRTIRYNKWNLIPDLSIRSIDGGARFHNIPESIARSSYGCQGMELVSPVFKYENMDIFERKLTAVKDALRGNAFNNKTTGLHLHLGIPYHSSQNPFASRLTLSVIRVLFFLWSACESQIQRFQPCHRHSDNRYCESLLTKIRRDQTHPETRCATLHHMAAELLKCSSLDDITFGVIRGQKRHTKVNISFATDTKPTTIEFREHFGTFSKHDIRQWIIFCRQMLLFAYHNRNQVWTEEWIDLVIEQTRNLERLSMLIGLDQSEAESLRRRRERVDNGEFDSIIACN